MRDDDVLNYILLGCICVLGIVLITNVKVSDFFEMAFPFSMAVIGFSVVWVLIGILWNWYQRWASDRELTKRVRRVADQQRMVETFVVRERLQKLSVDEVLDEKRDVVKDDKWGRKNKKQRKWGKQ